MRETENDLALLIDAAKAAGDIATQHFGNRPKAWEKSDGQGPVTQADLEIDAMLKARLTAARPEYGWLSEESTDDLERLERARVFVVDPIDGTRAFIDGQKGFAHVICVVEHGKPVAAVVHLPLLGHTYSAASGQGAYLGARPLQVSKRSAISGAQILVARPQLAARHWPGGVPECDRHFRPSLAWRLALVAEGAFDAMLTLRPTWHWDVAAGSLLVCEAGGVVSDGTGARLCFNLPEPRADGIIAAGPALHAALLERRNP